MKPIIFLPSLSWLVFALLASNAVSQPAVLDTGGKIVRPGVNYYVRPVIPGSGGGLTMAGRGNESCPLDVVQEISEFEKGFPIKLYPWNSKVGFVAESTDLNVEFSAITICIQSTVWKLDRFDKERKQWFVTTGGVKGKPGPDTISSWFKIEKSGNNYKFVFCPTVCDFCRPFCRDVGIFVDEKGVRRLALSNKPFLVMFKKAHDDSGKLSSIVKM